MLAENLEKWILKSEDNFGKHFEMLSLSKRTEGEMHIYEYESRLGFCRLRLCVEPKEFHLERLGEDKIDLKFSLGRRGKMCLKTSFYEQSFEVEGIELEEGEDFLQFSYRILENEDLVNEIRIHMKRRKEG